MLAASGCVRSWAAIAGDGSMPVHAHAPMAQWQGDAVRADVELQGRAPAGHGGQEVDHRCDGLRLEQLGS